MLKLPTRGGAKPATHHGIPHRQLDQTPPPELYRVLLQRFLRTEGTTHGPSLISVPGAQALFLDCTAPHDEAAFLRGCEFAHVHPATDGSFHLVLSAEDCARVLEAGWGELHPLAKTGEIPPTVVMVYAPRDEREVDIVLSVVGAARRNATSAVLAGRTQPA